MTFRIEHYTEPDGVAIERERGGKPIFVIPFPKDRFHRAESLDNDTVLFVGSKNALDTQNVLLLAVYDLCAKRFTRRTEVSGVTRSHHLLSRDRNRLFVAGNGIAVVDLRNLTLLKHYQCYKLEDNIGRVAAYADWPEGYKGARQEGWKHIFVQQAYQLGELRDGQIMFVEGTAHLRDPEEFPAIQRALTIDARSDQVQARDLLRTDGIGALSRIDPRAALAFVSSGQIAVFRAFVPLPPNAGHEGVLQRDASATENAKIGEPRYGLPFHIWSLVDADALPMTVVVRSEPPSQWKRGLETGFFCGTKEWTARDEALRMLNSLPSGTGAEDDACWSMAASAFIYEITEDPNDGTIWMSFADDCLRSLDGNGRLGPLIRLGGEPSQRYGPLCTFESDGTISVRRDSRRGLSRLRFDPRQFDGVAGPVSIEPLASETPQRRHEKAFAAFVRRQTRKRFTVPDWTRESCAAALQKQTKVLRNGFSDMVVASTERLNFAYRVDKSTLDEASFFAGLVERDVPVVNELRALLNTYLQALGEGGEGAQPWEDPDQGIGALGSALRALAILDPDALDIIRAYLEKRDGEHEGYSWAVVLPAYFERHGWRSAETVRFGVYAVLNRFWGGAHPYGLDGLREAMRELTTPTDVTQTVRREADAFGRRPEGGPNAAACRAAFCDILDPAITFEAAVLEALREETMQRS